MPDFSLHPALDETALARSFAQSGRVQIAPFVEDSQAQALAVSIAARDDWRELINAGERVYEFDRPGQRSLSADTREKLAEMVNAAARTDFQFRFESLRVPDPPEERRSHDDLLHAFASFLCADNTIRFFRTVTGFDDINFADAQATAYRPGDFLTAHDDDVSGKNRRAAYVFGLTPNWRAEWGGLLMFHEKQGDIERALLPRMLPEHFRRPAASQRQRSRAFRRCYPLFGNWLAKGDRSLATARRKSPGASQRCGSISLRAGAGLDFPQRRRRPFFDRTPCARGLANTGFKASPGLTDDAANRSVLGFTGLFAAAACNSRIGRRCAQHYSQ
jgi:SM-20-related protein